MHSDRGGLTVSRAKSNGKGLPQYPTLTPVMPLFIDIASHNNFFFETTGMIIHHVFYESFLSD